ncbi:hypothetical protein FDH38_gp028 [Dinoroseobacter phage vB_DshS-R5C]|uniref:Uncharacterized protein n=1 Tax=Dinoroseobacter phage vB_DshS-R5C TaxID=1965368 RepID=A0A1V0DY48_9CAUD|nr:hypothetical protein FDH38_gp028 [Dinoroseobacter phage vB_DshS-R5C]ARB06082.1 hypothetical protein vBDshSR5C_28 [Dinoroseobacter phage vB_DshS-R5C]
MTDTTTTKKKIKSPPTYNWTEPKHLARLRERMGDNCAEIGRAMGVAGSTINEHFANGRTLPVYELAAELLLQRMGDAPQTDAEAAFKALDDLALYFDQTPALRLDPQLLALVGRPLRDVLEERMS